MTKKDTPDIGRRIVIIGSTATGKTTLGSLLAGSLGVPLTDLDALYWRPDWRRPDKTEFASQVAAATRGDTWVVAGNYTSVVQEELWPRAETLIFLDYSLRLSLTRLIRRAFSRRLSREMLWGTNQESLGRYFRLRGWRESVITWTVRNHAAHRRRWAVLLADPGYCRKRLIRLCSPDEMQLWLSAATAAGSGAGT